MAGHSAPALEARQTVHGLGFLPYSLVNPEPVDSTFAIVPISQDHDRQVLAEEFAATPKPEAGQQNQTITYADTVSLSIVAGACTC